MTSTCVPELSEFAADVLEGLSVPHGKRLPPKYFYDDLGSALFEAITLLPEYGLARADQRILTAHANEIAALTGPLCAVAELGSGSGKKTLHVLRAQCELRPGLVYRPIDVSSAALAACEREIATLCEVEPICGEWMSGLSRIRQKRDSTLPLLVLFVGSSIGNIERQQLPEFLGALHSHLRPGDFFLLGADLVKDVGVMKAAYDDPTGVTAAFNLNLLGRINREFEADFDLTSFAHDVKWNAEARRIEMHLLCCRDQQVSSRILNTTFSFRAGETIWTESCHKFDLPELEELALLTGFAPLASWVDQEWGMAEVLWRAV
jgi:dimethylhistidine N-methyltransferase